MKTYPVALALAFLLGDSQALKVRGKPSSGGGGSTTTTTTTLRVTTTDEVAGYIGDDGSTAQLPVNKVCDGARERLANDNKAQVFKQFSSQTAVSQYTDPSFAPQSDVVMYWPGVQSGWSAYQFLRPSAAWGTSWSVWGSSGVKPAGIQQGSYGDCWMLATMGAIAEFPSRIQSIFTNFDTARGIYELKFWDQGYPRKVVIDDIIPLGQNLVPYGTKKGPDNSIWAVLMEKAAAKFYGTYARLGGGNFKEGYYVLTGRPAFDSWTYILTETTLFERIAAHDGQGDVMWAGCQNSVNCKAVNLVYAHAYTVFGARNFTDGNGVTWQLYNVRNPWGYQEYNGTWSDYDTVNMNAANAAALGHVIGTSNGDFWMPSSEYWKTFTSIGVGQYSPTDVQTICNSVWDKSNPASLVWTLTNPVQQDVYVGHSQPMNRQFMTSTCPTEQKLVAGEAFGMQIRQDGVALRDYWGRTTTFDDAKAGNDWLWLMNLPAGTYTLNMSPVAITPSGLLKFAILAWASSQAVTVTQNLQ